MIFLKIKKITKLKNEKYKIEFIDGSKLVTYDDVILKNNILYKKDLEEELYHKICLETLDYGLYNKVLKYALVKIRSEKEIQTYMDRLEIGEEQKEKIIQKLKANHFLDENKFTKVFISDKIHLSNIGPNKIQKELLEHGISFDFIQECLSDYDDTIFEEKIGRLIQKKITSQRCSNKMFQQKITHYLLDLGYDLNMIKRIMNQFSFDSTEAIEKDYLKLQKKLSSKYQDLQLQNQIKNKLYQKGYSLEEINQCIQKKEALSI